MENLWKASGEDVPLQRRKSQIPQGLAPALPEGSVERILFSWIAAALLSTAHHLLYSPE